MTSCAPPWKTGHREAHDLTGGLEEGFGWGDLSIADGVRQDAATAYLRPALRRPGLHVVTGALAHRVLLDGGHCPGVEYCVDDDMRTARLPLGTGRPGRRLVGAPQLFCSPASAPAATCAARASPPPCTCPASAPACWTTWSPAWSTGPPARYRPAPTTTARSGL